MGQERLSSLALLIKIKIDLDAIIDIFARNHSRLTWYCTVDYYATSVKEGHHNEWWTASREAHSKRAELTSGLSVSMSLCLFVFTYLSMYVCKRVSRSRSLLSQSAVVLGHET